MNVGVQVVVPAGAVLMLFALGLTLDPGQLVRLLERPRPLLIGLASRWILLPGLAVAICLLDPPAPPIALGLLVVASCPLATPGPALVRAGDGDTALAIALTAITNLASAVTLPVLLSVGALLVRIDGRVEPVDLIGVALRIAALVVVPTAMGMMLRRSRPVLARRMEPLVTPFALILLVPIVVLLLLGSWEVLMPALVDSGARAAALNLLALVGTALLARGARVPPDQTLALLVSSGLFNFGLGAFVSLTVLGDPQVFVPGIAYGALMWLTAAGAAGLTSGRRTG
jgi:bile acid:Na+ symporter, BASS family